MPLPFGLKAPSKGTMIFSGVAGALSGVFYTSNKNAEESRKRLAQRVSFLADRPCGVHEMPRKVTVYISAPPGDGLEKSRNWFREYVKPILVAGAVDYEVKEAKIPGQIETSVIEEVVQRRREAAAALSSESNNDSSEQSLDVNNDSNRNVIARPFVDDMANKKKQSEVVSDGILAIGRNAYREVLNGLSKGCDASLAIVEEVPIVEAEPTKEKEEKKDDNSNGEEMKITDEEQVPVASNEIIEPVSLNSEDVMEPAQEEQVDHFSLPNKFSPVMYIPHVNIIGWSNIPYRLYMWYADHKRIEDVGNYVVAAVLNETRPIEEKDADLGQQEKKYWMGDEAVEELLKNDGPIVIDERIIDKLSTYTKDN